MNNVTHISKAPRLTEEEVHKAAEALQESGVKVSTTEVYKHLGRGSLTTITNFLKTWRQDEPGETNTLPALSELPQTLKDTMEQATLRIWAEAKALIEKEMKIERETLKAKEAEAQARIDEAERFSDEQAKRIETLESDLESTLKELETVAKNQHENEKKLLIEKAELEKALAINEERLNNVLKENKKQEEEINKKHELEKENKRLDLQTTKLQLALDQAMTKIEEEKKLHGMTSRTSESYKEQLFELKGKFDAFQMMQSKKTTKMPAVKKEAVN